MYNCQMVAKLPVLSSLKVLKRLIEK